MKKFSDGNITKYVFENDGACYEAVLYKYPTYQERTVLCISTQCGCPVGCTFCGTGDQFIRNLSSEEIVSQVIDILADAKVIDVVQDHVINLVEPKKLQIMFMSMGEPFLNYIEVITAVEILSTAFPAADLLLSTIGPKTPNHFKSFLVFSNDIEKLGLQFSIHESTDYARSQLIPYKNKLTLREIRDYGIDWYAVTNRKVYLNYCINGKNNREDDANRLMNLFSPTAFAFTFSVVCASNETMKAAAYRDLESIEAFQEIFLNNGYDTLIFDPDGQDSIGGGCGQLWYVQKWMKENSKKGLKE